MKAPFFSIITVCKDCKDELEKTIRSIINQDFLDFEYIIIDGVSSDGSLELIQKYSSNDKRISYISEPDGGIYDAMNKGARIASGSFLEFLNAGDTFYNEEVLTNVSRIIKDGRADIFYGDSMFCYGENEYQIRRYPQWSSWAINFCFRDCINHQAIFANKSCFSNNTFDNFYLVGADRDWMIRMKKAGKRWKTMGITIVNYVINDDSFSIKNTEVFEDEVTYQNRKYYPWGMPLGWMIRKIREGKISSKILHALSDKMLFS